MTANMKTTVQKATLASHVMGGAGQKNLPLYMHPAYCWVFHNFDSEAKGLGFNNTITRLRKMKTALAVHMDYLVPEASSAEDVSSLEDKVRQARAALNRADDENIESAREALANAEAQLVAYHVREVYGLISTALDEAVRQTQLMHQASMKKVNGQDYSPDSFDNAHAGQAMRAFLKHPLMILRDDERPRYHFRDAPRCEVDLWHAVLKLGLTPFFLDKNIAFHAAFSNMDAQDSLWHWMKAMKRTAPNKEYLGQAREHILPVLGEAILRRHLVGIFNVIAQKRRENKAVREHQGLQTLQQSLWQLFNDNANAMPNCSIFAYFDTFLQKLNALIERLSDDVPSERAMKESLQGTITEALKDMDGKEATVKYEHVVEKLYDHLRTMYTTVRDDESPTKWGLFEKLLVIIFYLNSAENPFRREAGLLGNTLSQDKAHNAVLPVAAKVQKFLSRFPDDFRAKYFTLNDEELQQFVATMVDLGAELVANAMRNSSYGILDNDVADALVKQSTADLQLAMTSASVKPIAAKPSQSLVMTRMDPRRTA